MGGGNRRKASVNPSLSGLLKAGRVGIHGKKPVILTKRKTLVFNLGGNAGSLSSLFSGREFFI
ncbi:hypothetical protein BIZ35_14410 [Heyndrickxia coagulans]|uniref:Uncharacterized protein n=1 Tax=Heyndrickxia coagulans TaxID=1398 RepID=A0A150JRA0_HEYCO|nr:hypothetical protein BIZ35_14410 [Heyndrickxia coagulans]KYC59823.1 hypothetical protein B4098_1108 [Heyndrickxia coagulans]MDR4225116.1 hypothetical protein [Heyndrickxia coagulans DSM 1 = ATCC 7050]RGR79367.1 hypothetical protein DWY22_14055 [Heyndrickxia coagulans]RGR94171.1 hypothetical protein DWY16_14360 [Heyndrickxia coagulans]